MPEEVVDASLHPLLGSLRTAAVLPAWFVLLVFDDLLQV